MREDTSNVQSGCPNFFNSGGMAGISEVWRHKCRSGTTFRLLLGSLLQREKKITPYLEISMFKGKHRFILQSCRNQNNVVLE